MRCKEFDNGLHRLAEEYFGRHLVEESSHYDWAVDDLRSFRDDAADLLEETSIPEVIAVPGVALYLVEVIDPISLLGYITILETTPPSPEFVESLPGLMGVPRSAVRTLAVHAQEDQQHARDLFTLVDHPEMAQHAQLIRRAAAATVQSHALAMRSVLLTPIQL